MPLSQYNQNHFLASPLPALWDCLGATSLLNSDFVFACCCSSASPHTDTSLILLKPKSHRVSLRLKTFQWFPTLCWIQSSLLSMVYKSCSWSNPCISHLPFGPFCPFLLCSSHVSFSNSHGHQVTFAFGNWTFSSSGMLFPQELYMAGSIKFRTQLKYNLYSKEASPGSSPRVISPLLSPV